MELDRVTQVAFICASILSLAMACIFAWKLKLKNLHWTLVAASTIQTIWLLSKGLENILQLSPPHLMLLDGVHFSAWIFAVTQSTNYFCQTCLPRHYRTTQYSFCVSLIAIDVAYSIYSPSIPSVSTVATLQNIIFSIVGLLGVEQLYRNVKSVRLMKLIALNLAAVFIYDIYFFSQCLVQPELNPSLSQIRAAIVIITGVIMSTAAIALEQNPHQPARLSLSRPVVFYTTSLTLAGSVLAVISLGGYYVRIYGGNWGAIAYGLMLGVAIAALTVVITSRGIRENLAVLINKHLFSHKYDYRSEWLKLIDRLSQPTSAEAIHHHAINAVSNIFKSDGGALWLRKGRVLAPVYQENISLNIIDAIEPEDSAFIHALEKSEWVFLPSSSNDDNPLSQYNEHLPDWAKRIGNIWLILPLLNESQLIGFMVLTNKNNEDTLNWEDLDLLKTVGRQVANFLERHVQAEQLAEAKQFDAFNKLAAYVMHDLKNLIAQQSLVVKNAEKHKDNPAFVDDAIETINSSVARMNILLRKLQRNEPEGVRVLNLNDILIEAIKRCQKASPQPTLRNEDHDIRIKGDWDSLVMVFVHIIQNAQDATETSGFIDVYVYRDGITVRVAVEDNGEGMTPVFIRDRLFRPFDTTKTGKGMGIGAYQARDYIQALGGNIVVESTPNEGSTFTVSLPVTIS